jgi:hypothetical protein
VRCGPTSPNEGLFPTSPCQSDPTYAFDRHDRLSGPTGRCRGEVQVHRCRFWESPDPAARRGVGLWRPSLSSGGLSPKVEPRRIDPRPSKVLARLGHPLRLSMRPALRGFLADTLGTALTRGRSHLHSASSLGRESGRGSILPRAPDLGRVPVGLGGGGLTPSRNPDSDSTPR